jgi:hypothetical protein
MALNYKITNNLQSPPSPAGGPLAVRTMVIHFPDGDRSVATLIRLNGIPASEPGWVPVQTTTDNPNHTAANLDKLLAKGYVLWDNKQANPSHAAGIWATAPQYENPQVLFAFTWGMQQLAQTVGQAAASVGIPATPNGPGNGGGPPMMVAPGAPPGAVAIITPNAPPPPPPRRWPWVVAVLGAVGIGVVLLSD